MKGFSNSYLCGPHKARAFTVKLITVGGYSGIEMCTLFCFADVRVFGHSATCGFYKQPNVRPRFAVAQVHRTGSVRSRCVRAVCTCFKPTHPDRMNTYPTARLYPSPIDIERPVYVHCRRSVFACIRPPVVPGVRRSRLGNGRFSNSVPRNPNGGGGVMDRVRRIFHQIDKTGYTVHEYDTYISLVILQDYVWYSIICSIHLTRVSDKRCIIKMGLGKR